MKLLTTTLVSLLLMFSNLNLSAQDDKEHKPALITFTAGWSNSNIQPSSIGGNGNRHGLFAGIRKDVKLLPMLFFDTGILYVQEGVSNIDFTDEQGVAYQEDLKLDYIDIPVGVKFHLAWFYAVAGVSGNFKISDNLDDFYSERSFKTFDITSSLGAGIKFLMLSAEIRWNYSLGDIAKNNSGDPLRNNYLMIGLGFSIHKR